MNDATAGNQHIVVAAAGNGTFFGTGENIDTSPFYPASYKPTLDNLISVAATDNKDKFGSFSNYGTNSVDLAAPGVNIYSTQPLNKGTYGTKSGTSMAAPHVAGAAALVWSVEPGLTAAQVKALLLNNTDSIAALNSSKPTVTKGRLNVDRAIRAIGPPPTPDDLPTVQLASPLAGAILTGEVTLTATVEDDHGVVGVEFFAGSTKIGEADIDGSDGWSVNWDTSSQPNGAVALTAKATDTVDQTATSSPVSVTLDNPAGDPILLFSLGTGVTLGGIAFANEDIVAASSTQFSKYFDGSDVGLSSLTLDAFALLSETTIVMSFTGSATIGGLSVDDSDLVKFTATSLGEVTAGAWSMYFDGSDVGLTTDNEDIDAVEIRPDGSLLISTNSSVSVSGASASGEDILRFVPTRLGSSTAGTWSVYFDGSDVSLSSSENIDALALAADGKLYLSTGGSFSVPSRTGGKEDVFVFTPTRTGSTTAGSYSPALAFDGSPVGLDGNDINDIALPLPPPVATSSSSSATTTAALDQFFFDLFDPSPKKRSS